MLLPSPLPAHPRLLASPADWIRLRTQVETDPASRAIWETLRQRADAICAEAPLERVMIGRMLLMVSRQTLERISVLSLVAQLTGDGRYSARAIEEMLAICRFADWNPSHFLDTAELCLAISIGYDWLHAEFLPDQQDEIATALLDKGITPSMDGTARSNWWLTTDENWAQVCHGGLSAAAIVLADRVPDLSETILKRALAALPPVAASYAPDGAYPEGPMYWSYGTGYHVVLAAAMARLTGDTQGVDAYPGFVESADFINAVTAPSGDYFNYSDCAAQRRLQAQLFWMADRCGRPDWLVHDLATLDTDLAEYRRDPGVQYWYYDMVALALLWHRPARPIETAKSAPTFWTGSGPMPVAIYRWGDDMFLGVKGGSAGYSHSHMDVGSFVFEAGGERWIVDAGMQDYAALEKAGVDLWNEREPSSPRWSVFRIGPESHNILRFDGQPQLLLKRAPLDARPASCSVDMSGIYGAPVTTATRRFTPGTDGFAVEDSWTASAATAATSQVLTTAEIEHNGDALILSKNGRRLQIEAQSSATFSIVIEDFSQPPQPYDAPNPGLKRISVRSAPSASGSIALTFRLLAAQ